LPISRRTAQTEEAVEFLLDLVKIPPKLQLYVSVLGFLVAAGVFTYNFPNQKFDSAGFWLYFIIGGGLVLATWVFSYVLGPLILYVCAVYLTYHTTESIGLGLLTLIAFPILSHKITNALEAMEERGAPAVDSVHTTQLARPKIGRGVKSFAAVTLGSLALLIAWVAYQDIAHRSTSQTASPPAVTPTG
jgi:hypothetical protein